MKAMLAMEAASGQYLSEHPGQAFCRDCLVELSSGDEGLEDRVTVIPKSYRTWKGTCFNCREERQVVESKPQ
jgi:hypothetical protein